MSIVLFANELYGLPILRPLSAAARARDIDVAWVVTDSMARRMHADETRLVTKEQVRQWQPQSVFCAANWVLPSMPGYKVQVFHGFSTDKRSRDRGHFRLRGFFDLYCTQGPDTTEPFEALARATDTLLWKKPAGPSSIHSSARPAKTVGHCRPRPMVDRASCTHPLSQHH